MLFFFYLITACLAVPQVLVPLAKPEMTNLLTRLKSSKNDGFAKILISALAGADPDAVRHVKSLVQALIDAGEAERQAVTDDRDTKQAEFDTASGNLDTATDEHTAVSGELYNAQQDVVRLTQEKEDREVAVGEAQDVFDDSVARLGEAETYLSDETTRIDSEKLTLLEIRELLASLLSGGGGEFNYAFADSSCVAVDGNSFLPTGSGWGCQLCSTENMVTSFTEGVSGFGFNMPEDHVLHIMIGLNQADAACNSASWGMSWGLCLRGQWGNAGIQIYDKNGGGVTPSSYQYSAGDAFEVVVKNQNTVVYKRNGDVVYESTGATVNLPLAFDFSVYTPSGGSITNLHAIYY